MNFKNLTRRGLVVGFSLASLALFPSGCGSDDPPASITLTGTLDGARAPLAGFKFKCVTLTNPAFSGTATADAAGAFSLDFSAAGVPFGCFVLNASDVQVATAFFTSSTSSTTGQTISIGASTSLGTVAVDTTRGSATATVAATLTTSSPGGLDCPVGIWTGTVGINTDCSGDTVTATLWVGKDSTGNYVLSQTLSPHKQGTCGVSAFAPTGGTVTYASNVMSWSLDFGHAGTAEATVASDCSNISLRFTQNGCGTCNPSGADLATQCQGTGVTNNCQSNSFVLTKP